MFIDLNYNERKYDIFYKQIESLYMKYDVLLEEMKKKDEKIK